MSDTNLHRHFDFSLERSPNIPVLLSWFSSSSATRSPPLLNASSSASSSIEPTWLLVVRLILLDVSIDFSFRLKWFRRWYSLFPSLSTLHRPHQLRYPSASVAQDHCCKAKGDSEVWFASIVFAVLVIDGGLWSRLWLHSTIRGDGQRYSMVEYQSRSEAERQFLVSLLLDHDVDRFGDLSSAHSLRWEHLSWYDPFVSIELHSLSVRQVNLAFRKCGISRWRNPTGLVLIRRRVVARAKRFPTIKTRKQTFMVRLPDPRISPLFDCSSGRRSGWTRHSHWKSLEVLW